MLEQITIWIKYSQLLIKKNDEHYQFFKITTNNRVRIKKTINK